MFSAKNTRYKVAFEFILWYSLVKSLNTKFQAKLLKGAIMLTLTTDELIEATDAVAWPAKATLEQKQAYRIEIAALEAQWAAWLDVEYGSYIPSAFRPVIFRKAWADGHSSGYHTVEDYYEQYASFAGDAIRSHILEGYGGI